MSYFSNTIRLPGAPQHCAFTEPLYELRTPPHTFAQALFE